MKGGELMFMPKHMNHSTRGFTLIELLIVIGIIGILAVGLLAAVDPLEQLKKGNDTNKKRIAVEFQQASSRFFAVRGQPAWLAGTVPAAANMTNAAVTAMITNMQTAGELKSSFQSAITTVGVLLFVNGTAATGDVTVCFAPESKAERTNYTALYSDNVGSSVCTITTGIGCFWCAR